MYINPRTQDTQVNLGLARAETKVKGEQYTILQSKQSSIKQNKTNKIGKQNSGKGKHEIKVT